MIYYNIVITYEHVDIYTYNVLALYLYYTVLYYYYKGPALLQREPARESGPRDHTARPRPHYMIMYTKHVLDLY